MAGINKVILIGNLGKAPELRAMPSGDAVANTSLATSESWKDKNGEKQERIEWHNLVFFGKLAEVAGQYLKKGSKIYVEGKIRTDKYQGENGEDRYATKIIVATMQMLDGRRDDGDRNIKKENVVASSPPDFDDDIPF